MRNFFLNFTTENFSTFFIFVEKYRKNANFYIQGHFLYCAFLSGYKFEKKSEFLDV